MDALASAHDAAVQMINTSIVLVHQQEDNKLGNLLRADRVSIGYAFCWAAFGSLMPGNPNECRARAAYCVEMAAETTNTVIKTTFSDLARQWTKLATDIEMAVALRRELEPDPKSDGSGGSRSSL